MKNTATLRTLALAASVAAAALIASPALAHGNHGKGHKFGHKHGHGHGHQAHDRHDRCDRHRDHRRSVYRDRARYGIDYRYDRYSPREIRRFERFDLPRVIVRADVRRYAPYYLDDRYDRHHRHSHAVYRFPVRIDGHWTLRDHEYCDGRLFVAGGVRIDGRRFSVSFGF